LVLPATLDGTKVQSMSPTMLAVADMKNIPHLTHKYFGLRSKSPITMSPTNPGTREASIK
jgi:hypothetical protein